MLQGPLHDQGLTVTERPESGGGSRGGGLRLHPSALLSVLVATALAVFAFSLPASAGSESIDTDIPFEITADSIEFDQVRQLYVADGAVRVVQGKKRLTADWVAFSTENERGVAAGDVHYTDGEDLLRAEYMQFDVTTLEGVLYEGEFDSGGRGFRVWAMEIVRTGPKTYELTQGTFTTCRCDDDDWLPDPWRIRASKADAEPGRTTLIAA